MVDNETQFRVAEFVEPLTTRSVSETIPTSRESVNTRLLKRFVFDDGLQFRDTLVEISEIYNTKWQRSGTHHHSALGIGKYHSNQ